MDNFRTILKTQPSQFATKSIQIKQTISALAGNENNLNRLSILIVRPFVTARARTVDRTFFTSDGTVKNVLRHQTRNQSR